MTGVTRSRHQFYEWLFNSDNNGGLTSYIWLHDAMETLQTLQTLQMAPIRLRGGFQTLLWGSRVEPVLRRGVTAENGYGFYRPRLR